MKRSALVYAGLCCLVICGWARAATISIDDSGDGVPIVTVTGATTGQGFSVAPFGTPEQVHFTWNSAVNVAAGQEGQYYFDFYEDANLTQLSDRFFITLVAAGSPLVQVDFYSDVDGVPASIPPGTTTGNGRFLGSLQEDGTSQHVIDYINLGSGGVIDSYFVRSDAVEAPAPSVAWSGLGLVAGLGAYRVVRARRAVRA